MDVDDKASDVEDKEDENIERKLDVITTEEDGTCVTFVLKGEDHTLGNALRYMIMKNPATEFCGYTVPHPSDELIRLRIQTRGGVLATVVLRTGLEQLMQCCKHIKTSFDSTAADYRGQHPDSLSDPM